MEPLFFCSILPWIFAPLHLGPAKDPRLSIRFRPGSREGIPETSCPLLSPATRKMRPVVIILPALCAHRQSLLPGFQAKERFREQGELQCISRCRAVITAWSAAEMMASLLLAWFVGLTIDSSNHECIKPAFRVPEDSLPQKGMTLLCAILSGFKVMVVQRYISKSCPR